MKRILYLTILCLLLSGGIGAQVTIGSGQKPSSGALLDLKEKNNPVGEEGKENANKGLGLPRVELTDLNKLKMGDNDIADAPITGGTVWKAHIGLIVYNTKDAVWDPATCKTEGGPGLYVWNGSQWQGIGVQTGGTPDPLETETATTLTDREGNTYPIATFGTAGTWMTQNLRTTTAPGLTAMIESAANSTTDMYYAYPNGGNPYTVKPGTWTAREGALYNWQATMNKNTCETVDQGQGEAAEQTDVIQGICPFGWHVPSDKEWNQLEQIISEDAASYAANYGGAGGAWTETYPAAVGGWRGNHGMLLQSASQVGGGTPAYSKPAGSGGLDLLLAGSAGNGSASNFGTHSYFWSASSDSANFAWCRYTSSTNTRMARYANTRSYLFSVRCVKN